MDEIQDFETLSLLKQFSRFLSESGKDERAHDMAYVMLTAALRIEQLRHQTADLRRKWAKAELEASTQQGRAVVAERKLQRLIDQMP
jgi:hypothetical protein